MYVKNVLPDGWVWIYKDYRSGVEAALGRDLFGAGLGLRIFDVFLSVGC